MDTKGIFVGGLEKRPANYQPLSPTIFLDWAATTYPNKNAIIHGTSTYSWSTFYKRCRLLASALEKRGIQLASNQVEYSILNRKIESNGVLKRAQELGVSIIAYSPFNYIRLELIIGFSVNMR